MKGAAVGELVWYCSGEQSKTNHSTPLLSSQICKSANLQIFKEGGREGVHGQPFSSLLTLAFTRVLQISSACPTQAMQCIWAWIQ